MPAGHLRHWPRWCVQPRVCQRKPIGCSEPKHQYSMKDWRLERITQTGSGRPDYRRLRDQDLLFIFVCENRRRRRKQHGSKNLWLTRASLCRPTLIYEKKLLKKGLMTRLVELSKTQNEPRQRQPSEEWSWIKNNCTLADLEWKRIIVVDQTLLLYLYMWAVMLKTDLRRLAWIWTSMASHLPRYQALRVVPGCQLPRLLPVREGENVLTQSNANIFYF